MKLTAIYKTFDGEEWLTASLRSIYDSVDAIVLVHSDVSWAGESGNTCRDVAKRWQDEHDTAGKMHHVQCDTSNQMHQYKAGLEHAEKNGIPLDAVMAVDADEIWDAGMIDHARKLIRDNRQQAYQVCMHTYVKTPFYRVDPPFGHPVTFFRDPSWLTKAPRGCRAPSMLLHDVWMHHLTYVRKDWESVNRKLKSSCLADGNEQCREGYKEEVWDKLPFSEAIHGFKRWSKVWQKIEPVWMGDLPEAVRSSETMSMFLPDGLLMDGERDVLRDLTKGIGIAIDLGTYQGLSAVIASLGAQEVHTFDVYEDVVPMETFADPMIEYAELWRRTRHTLEGTMHNCRWYSNIHAYHCDTAKAADQFAESSVDFVFIDADHSYQGTRQNWAAWYDKLRPGGVLLFHDDNDIHPGVQQACRELRGSPKLVSPMSLQGYPGTLAAFQKVSQ